MYDHSAALGDPPAFPPADLLKDSSLFLDFDGTLVDIADTPDAVRVSAQLPALLARVADRLDGRIAIVTGRSVNAVRELLRAPSLTVVGSHGMEFSFADGRTAAGRRPLALEDVRRRMTELATKWPQVLVEDKALGTALHYRLCPGAEADCVSLATDLAERHGLFLQTGKMMVEVRAAGGDKGTAIRQLMQEPEIRHTRPIFIGDDDTDEPGFLAVQYFGGAGILVGARRPTAARFYLPDVTAVLDWLEAACRT